MSISAAPESGVMPGSPDESEVVLVDSQGKPLGTAPKLKAHQDGGALHRAISVLVFDPQGRLLIQRRASGKYHSPGSWANTCCSHPKPGEAIEAAAHRRLKEEMGFDCPLREVFDFTYRIDVGGHMTEHEFDHVFVGTFSGEPHPDPREVGEYRWVPLQDLFRDVRADSKEYAPWFKIILVHLGEMDLKQILK